MASAEQRYTVAELMACVFAREMRGMHLVNIPGMRSEVPLAAVGLAVRLHAPDLEVFNVGPVSGRQLFITGSTMDYERAVDAEGIMQGERIYDMLHKGLMDCSFGGAMQIDQYGNTNLVCIGDYGHPRVRGPGAAGTISTSMGKRLFIWINEHSPRVFVEKVDFISVPGPLARKAAGARRGGEIMVVTPLAVLDMNPAKQTLRVKSIHPGATADEVRAKTGFAIEMPNPVPRTQPPSDEEVSILRTHIDPQGILRNEEPNG